MFSRLVWEPPNFSVGCDRLGGTGLVGLAKLLAILRKSTTIFSISALPLVSVPHRRAIAESKSECSRGRNVLTRDRDRFVESGFCAPHHPAGERPAGRL